MERRRHRGARAALVLAASLVVAACGGGDGMVDQARNVGEAPPPVRVSMAALHAMGGVPVDWKLTPPPGDATRGRRLFAHYGCPSCHLVGGEDFPQQGKNPGPELTGMGAHHPPGYFVESILNPNAVVLEGDGYASASGLSTMPAYPEMPLVDLTDLVAYLASLTTGHDHAAMMAGPAGAVAPPVNLVERPGPPPQAGGLFLVMRFDVLPGKLTAFETWFRESGRSAFLAHDGVEGIDTYVVGGADAPAVVTIFTFRDQRALEAFLADPAGMRLGEEWDSFVGPHGHEIFRRPPVYRVDGLSASR